MVFDFFIVLDVLLLWLRLFWLELLLLLRSWIGILIWINVFLLGDEVMVILFLMSFRMCWVSVRLRLELEIKGFFLEKGWRIFLLRKLVDIVGCKLGYFKFLFFKRFIFMFIVFDIDWYCGYFERIIIVSR